MRLRFLIFVILGCTVPLWAATGQTHHRVAKKAEAVVTAPVPAPPPPTPAQMPATPPTVAFAAGQLTITAPNSTLGDILREVRKQTGASVEIPGNATERVMGTFGPGPARDVLASLLNGSHFNYVLLGSASNPEALDRVMLLSKSAADAGTQQVAANTPGQPPSAPAGGAQAETMEFGNDDADPQQDASSADIFGNADDQSNQQADDQQQGQPFGQQGNNVRTPQQMLQELQQQQQQQQNGTLPNGVPVPGGARFGEPGLPTPGIPPNPNPQ